MPRPRVTPRFVLGGLLLAAALAIAMAIAAWLILGNQSPEPVIQGRSAGSWMTDLVSNDAARSAPARDALLHAPDLSVPYLSRVLASRPDPTVASVQAAYARAWSSTIIPGFLRKLLPSPIPASDQWRLGAGMLLAELGPHATSAVPALARTLADPREELVVLAATTLGQTGPAGRPALAHLASLIASRMPEARHAAVEALVRLGDPSGETLPLLTPMLQDPDGGTRSCAAVALWLAHRQPQPALDLLRNRAGPDGWRDRWYTALCLGGLRDLATPAIPHLEALLDDDDDRVRAQAGRALQDIRTSPTPATSTAVP